MSVRLGMFHLVHHSLGVAQKFGAISESGGGGVCFPNWAIGH